MNANEITTGMKCRIQWEGNARDGMLVEVVKERKCMGVGTGTFQVRALESRTDKKRNYSVNAGEIADYGISAERLTAVEESADVTMEYAIIVFPTQKDMTTGKGTVYGWYESLATALKTCTNLTQQGTFYHAVAMKVL